jgi:carbamoyl-phosphate synthase small subunit
MAARLKPEPNAALLLADGTVFSGYGIGASGAIAGEICFNTAMTGYQEILTDPSYAGQIITFTFPHVGNIGTNEEDVESASTVMGACGLILREPITDPSNFRSHGHFNAWLKARGVTGISGVDTRALTRYIRENGAQNAAIVYSEKAADLPKQIEKAKKELEAAPDMNGLELAAHVTTSAPYPWKQKRWQLGKGYTELAAEGAELYHVVAIDFGEKLNILRCLASQNCRVTVVPATTTADDILALNPNGVFLSNGPGDPAATANYAAPTIRALIAANVVVFGICLGHQLLGLALGARTEKMKQGHRGANHPVKDITTGKVEITSQNHGFCVCDANLPSDVEITHRSLFDNCIEGLRHKTKPAFSVQYHPESSPGPHDSHYLFERFVKLMAAQKKKAA